MAALALFAATIFARPHQPLDSIDALDRQIKACLRYLSGGDIRQARLLARQLAWRFPDFGLGQLIHAELESASAFKDVSIAGNQPMNPRITELLLEAQRRLEAPDLNLMTRGSVEDSELDSAVPLMMPGNLVQTGKNLSQLVVVDLQASILYQYRLDQQHSSLVRHHYIGSGEGGFGKQVEGDLKTPLGVYTISGYLADASLPDLYGAGALTLDYPNTLDQYLGRTGYGIWLHGVPSSQRSRSPYSSEGCVTMSNQHLDRLASELDASSTRVILTGTGYTLDSKRRADLAARFQDLFTQYQKAWTSGTKTQLMNLYSDHEYLEARLRSDDNTLLKVSDNLPNAGTATQTYEKLLLRQAFKQVKAEDVSIFINPQLAGNERLQLSQIIIDAIFGANSEYQITIYWSLDDDGQWRVMTDSLTSSGL